MSNHLKELKTVEKDLIRGGEVYRRKVNYYKLKARKESRNVLEISRQYQENVELDYNWSSKSGKRVLCKREVNFN